MRDKRDSLKNSDSQKNSSSSGSYASNAGRRAVRGLARKLRQKNLHDPHIISDECKVKMSDKDICNGDPSNSSEEVTSTSKRKDEKFEHQPMEEPVCFSVVPETMEVGLEDLEDQMDDEVTAIPETVEDSLPCEEEERDGEKSKTEEDEEEDTDLTDEKTTGIGELNDGINEKTTRIQEELKPDDSEKRKEKGLERSLVSVKEDSLRMDDIQEGEDNKVKMDDVVSSPAQSSRQEFWKWRNCWGV
ncbi:cilia- and flagella-associated protein 251-like [Saccostrea cucullata]|uniref:cilia- and flagella-associated protein 251-like n=1 Tax=Saccostrea cuccullata TaxID=36930 RepID=UPI002ED29160